MGGYKIKTIEPGTKYKIKKADGSVYIVRFKGGTGSCTCVGYKYRGDCKHLNMVAHQQTPPDRLPAETVIKRVQPLFDIFQDVWTRYEICGSYRRGRIDLKDLDVVVEGDLDLTKTILAQAEIPIDTGKKGDKRRILRFKWKGVPVDLWFVDKSTWGAALLYLTGPKEFNVIQRGIAKHKGYKLNQDGLFSLKTNKRVAGTTEQSIFSKLRSPYLTPQQREKYRIALKYERRSA